MKLSIEMEAEDWLSLCSFHACIMEMAVKNIGNDPITYSKTARITNEIMEQIVRKIPNEEFERIKSDKDHF
jgi:hypothetical protein